MLLSIARGLVFFPEKVSVDVEENVNQKIITYHLHVSKEDMGRVIGKHGRIALAIRKIISAAASIKSDFKVLIEID
jgi:predicted RNA-binding protein YlqC (UPF0109 family)